jgi:hypothetical protein
MSAILTFIRSEPVLIAGGVQAALGLATAFGLHLTGEQTGAILAFSAAALAIACRRAVTPSLPPASKE